MDWFKRIFQGASEILTDKQTFVNTQTGAVQVPNADDETPIGKARNTLQGAARMAKDLVLPTRGFTEAEISAANPTLKDRFKAVSRFPAELVSGLGALSNYNPSTRKLNEAILRTRVGQRLADAGDAITEYGKPKNAAEAQTMRLTDILTLPVGGTMRGVSKADELNRLIDANRVRKVLKDGKEALQVQAPGGLWMNVDDEATAIRLASEGPTQRPPSNIQRSRPTEAIPVPAARAQSAALPPSPARQSPAPSPVPREEAASLEEAAQQLHEALPTSYRQKVDPLDKIISQPTPLSRKINLVDYFRTPDRVLEKIGFGGEARMLRQQYEKYVMELPGNIEKVTEWSRRAPGAAANKRIFNYLDGKKGPPLPPNEQRVADEIRGYLEEWADRLKIPKGNRIASYITHIFDDQLVNKEFDEDLAKIISERLPGEVYDPFLESRLGKRGYKQDTWAALDAYTKRATRKVHMDPVLEQISARAGSSIDTANIEESQFRFIKEYIDRVNLRPTRLDNLLDNTVKQVVGYRFGQRPVTAITSMLRRMTYRGMLGANLGSALRNLSQGVNTYAVLGEKYTAIGYAKLFSPSARNELKVQGILDNTIITDRTISATRKTLEKADKALWFFFDQAEKINRGAAYFGGKAKALGQGMKEAEAIEYAKKLVRKTQFNYDPVDTPVALSADLVKTLTQFQTYTTKQTEFLAELARDRNFAAFVRYGLAGYLFVNTIGQAMGMEEKELLPLFRFDVPPSLKLPWELAKAAVDAPDKYGNDRDLAEKFEDIGKASIGLIPGGSQIKKTVQGLQAVEEGGSYDAAGRLQFEQEDTPAAKLQTVLFGKYAGDNAKAYFDKKEGNAGTGDRALDQALEEQEQGRKELNQREVQINRELSSLPPEEANARLKAIYDEDKALYKRVVAAKKEADKLAKLSDTEKGMLRLGVENGARARFIVERVRQLETPEAKNAYLKDLYDKKIITKEVLEQIRELEAQ